MTSGNQSVRRRQPRPFFAVDSARAFRITVVPGRGDTYGVLLEETYGENGHTLAARVALVTPGQTGRVVDALFAAVRASGHAPSVLAFNRKAPIRIDEAEGVRLALILLTTQPVTKHNRVRSLVAGINAMSTEETYYWYSKCISGDSSRARRALRTLLADD
ncbi:hypothetical protein FLW53_21920 [Microbispora sp. SCL1-1]|uniref:DUF7680 family protein n=1 Tax=unclassified Microbispora TaxID=2614687 RepID=UPI001159AFDF|nr:MULTISPECIES: hypothetical protein [unclassified Microbispora]NJP26799.1 hypothetical protein [Microbispora sp. CL1-1]TQS11994.1 hypothetical protein FLW53_21920 [Microbispora sp. SCL1-1]